MQLHGMADGPPPPPTRRQESKLPRRYKHKLPPTPPTTYPPTYPTEPTPPSPPPTPPARPNRTSHPSRYHKERNMPPPASNIPDYPPSKGHTPNKNLPSGQERQPPPRRNEKRGKSVSRQTHQTKMAEKQPSFESNVLFAEKENQIPSDIAAANIKPKQLWKPAVELGVQINDIISNSGKGATYKTSITKPSFKLDQKKKSKGFQFRAAPTSTEFGTSTQRPLTTSPSTTTPVPTPPNPRNHLNMLKNGLLKKNIDSINQEKKKKQSIV